MGVTRKDISNEKTSEPSKVESIVGIIKKKKTWDNMDISIEWKRMYIYEDTGNGNLKEVHQ